MSLVALLTDQQQRLDALISLLSSEQNLLTQGDIDGDALTQVAHDKQILLGELERIEAVRRNVQKRLGYAEGASGARAARISKRPSRIASRISSTLVLKRRLMTLVAKLPGKAYLKKVSVLPV